MVFLQKLGITEHQYIAPIVVPFYSIKNSKILLFKESQSVTILWKYQYKQSDTKDKIKPMEFPLVIESLQVQLRLYYDGRVIFCYDELSDQVKKEVLR